MQRTFQFLILPKVGALRAAHVEQPNIKVIIKVIARAEGLILEPYRSKSLLSQPSRREPMVTPVRGSLRASGGNPRDEFDHAPQLDSKGESKPH